MAFYNSGSALVPPLSLLLLLLLLMYSIQIASWAAFIFGASIIHQWHYGQCQAEWTPLSAAGAGAAAADVFVSPSPSYSQPPLHEFSQDFLKETKQKSKIPFRLARALPLSRFLYVSFSPFRFICYSACLSFFLNVAVSLALRQNNSIKYRCP